jgi:hypothetical protein
LFTKESQQGEAEPTDRIIKGPVKLFKDMAECFVYNEIYVLLTIIFALILSMQGKSILPENRKKKKKTKKLFLL